LQNALQQLSALQNGSLTPAQLQILGQQQTAPASQMRAASLLSRR
jgi:hypothetical protein